MKIVNDICHNGNNFKNRLTSINLLPFTLFTATFNHKLHTIKSHTMLRIFDKLTVTRGFGCAYKI